MNIGGVEIPAVFVVVVIIAFLMVAGLVYGITFHGLPRKVDPYSQAKKEAQRQQRLDVERMKRVKTLRNILGRVKNALQSEASKRGFLMQEAEPTERLIRAYLHFHRGVTGTSISRRVTIAIEPNREGMPVQVRVGTLEPIGFGLSDVEINQAIELARSYIEES